MAAAVSMAKELGVKKSPRRPPEMRQARLRLTLHARNGNVSFYAARHARANIIECEQMGANVTLVDG
jgi:hypothetical protein